MGFLPGIESTDGSLPAYERVFAARPEVYAAWRSLVAAIRDGLDDRTYEVATVGAARALHSTYCSLAHSVVLAGPPAEDRTPDDHDGSPLRPPSLAPARHGPSLG